MQPVDISALWQSPLAHLAGSLATTPRWTPSWTALAH